MPAGKFPVSPYPTLSFKSLIKSTSLIKSSLKIFHPAEIVLKDSHLLSSGSLDEPSVLKDAVIKYLSSKL